MIRYLVLAVLDTDVVPVCVHFQENIECLKWLKNLTEDDAGQSQSEALRARTKLTDEVNYQDKSIGTNTKQRRPSR